MPIYEYVCEACEHAFERRQSFDDEPITVCPECGEEAVKRLISVPGVVFKGSGWYIKDSKKGGALTSTSDSDRDDSSGTDATASNDSSSSDDERSDKKGESKDTGGKKKTSASDTATSDGGTSGSGTSQ